MDKYRQSFKRIRHLFRFDSAFLKRRFGLEYATSPLYSSAKADELEKEVILLKEQVRIAVESLHKTSKDKASTEKQVRELQETSEKLQQKMELAFLLNNVSRDAHDAILSNEDFRNNFLNKKVHSAFVVSADIRRSTELMLKSKSPEMFASFMTSLWAELEAIFKKNYGVVDKFTGDGILAFFPEFFSGDDAGYLALLSCFEAQKAFERIYQERRSSFTCVLKDAGVGAGIDYGSVNLLRMAGSLTVVGQPVVYACRLSSAPPGRTFINQTAFDQISARFGHVYLSEVVHEVKHEGRLVCYEASIRPSEFKVKLPSWMPTSGEAGKK